QRVRREEIGDDLHAVPYLRRFARCAVLACAALAVAGCTKGTSGSLAVTGTIEGTTIGIGSRVGGRVADVSAAEGDRVTAGQVLVKLDCGEQEAALEAAHAKLGQAEATLDRLENGARPEELAQAQAAAAAADAQYTMALNGARSQEIKAAHALADSAKAQLDAAQTEFDRAKNLRESQATSQQVYDQALHRLEAAQGQYDAAREQVDLLAKGTREEQVAIAKADRDRAAAAYDLLKNGARKEDLDAARASTSAAKADVRRAETLLAEMTVKAPRDAVVESFDVHPGDLVQPGAILRVTDPEDLKLVVYVSALVLGHLRVGQDVSFTTDSHGAETFAGKISYLAPSGEFTPRNLQTQEERVQQVFGMKVAFDSNGGKLRPGMAATVHIPLDATAK
ncbi:MAG: HlyD family efflux transporter periplasmic adaptor subunit, partial [Candidatus Hydrogenedentes bacterium]|nr:HlyD family efflux transporter periplasmic adaptor subunit [Candidatus Hydrogenedentota bacterium]